MDKEEKRRKKKRDRERKSSTKKKRRVYESDEDGSQSLSSGSEERERSRVKPETVIREMMSEFPNAGNDLKQVLLYMFLIYSIFGRLMKLF